MVRHLFGSLALIVPLQASGNLAESLLVSVATANRPACKAIIEGSSLEKAMRSELQNFQRNAENEFRAQFKKQQSDYKNNLGLIKPDFKRASSEFRERAKSKIERIRMQHLPQILIHYKNAILAFESQKQDRHELKCLGSALNSMIRICFGPEALHSNKCKNTIATGISKYKSGLSYPSEAFESKHFVMGGVEKNLNKWTAIFIQKNKTNLAIRSQRAIYDNMAKRKCSPDHFRALTSILNMSMKIDDRNRFATYKKIGTWCERNALNKKGIKILWDKFNQEYVSEDKKAQVARAKQENERIYVNSPIEFVEKFYSQLKKMGVGRAPISNNSKAIISNISLLNPEITLNNANALEKTLGRPSSGFIPRTNMKPFKLQYKLRYAPKGLPQDVWLEFNEKRELVSFSTMKKSFIKKEIIWRKEKKPW